MKKLKLKNAESYLQEIETFLKPKPDLEQYQTTPRTAAEILIAIRDNYDDIEGKRVADLGCGTGIFSIGAIMFGAKEVVSFDLDKDALEIADRNAKEFQCADEIKFTNCDIAEVKLEEKVDTVIMNPPFGTKKEGIDMVFLQKALEICNGNVYSIHKSSTREYIKKQSKLWNAEFEVIFSFNFVLPKTMKFHKQDVGKTEVDLIRIKRLDTEKSVEAPQKANELQSKPEEEKKNE